MQTHLYLILTFKASVMPGIRISSPSGCEHCTLEPWRLKAPALFRLKVAKSSNTILAIFIPFPSPGRSYLCLLVWLFGRDWRSLRRVDLKRPDDGQRAMDFQERSPLFDVCLKLYGSSRALDSNRPRYQKFPRIINPYVIRQENPDMFLGRKNGLFRPLKVSFAWWNIPKLGALGFPKIWNKAENHMIGENMRIFFCKIGGVRVPKSWFIYGLCSSMSLDEKL